MCTRLDIQYLLCPYHVTVAMLSAGYVDVVKRLKLDNALATQSIKRAGDKCNIPAAASEIV
jgi:hypothetical protein